MLLTRKNPIFIFAGVLVMLGSFVSCKKSDNSNKIPPVDTTTVKPVYSLVWSDEFNGTSVDATKWTFETGGGGWGNNELEYYQPQNATVNNGNLVITAKKETVSG